MRYGGHGLSESFRRWFLIVVNVDKIRHPSAFAEVIYQILAEQLINRAAIDLLLARKELEFSG